MASDTLRRLAEFVAEMGHPAMVAGGVVVWYVDGWQRCTARSWSGVWHLLGA